MLWIKYALAHIDWNDKATYYSDGVHPTAAGHQILGNIAATAINSILV